MFLVLFLFLFSINAQAQNVIEQTFQLINHNRKLNNLNELVWNDDLAKAAKNHSNWMAKVGTMTHIQGEYPKNFFELKSCEHHPVNRIIKSGYYPFEKAFDMNYYSGGVSVKSKDNINDIWGEVIAHGKSNGDARYPYRADVCVDGWMRSPGHKEQLLKPTFKEMGIAITARSNNEVFWCVNFGTRD